MSWKQIIPRRRLFIVLQRILGFKVKELAKGTEDLQGYHNPFLDLPNELLLVIANFLEKEFQVVLSLSCRQLHILLNSSLDLSLCDLTMKLRFLQYLEPDYPEYLTCRSCGIMFKWQTRGFLSYRCPRTQYHSIWTSYPWCMTGGPNILVTREVVDLIFRAHERGQRYGLPLSFLSTSGTDYNDLTRTNEARLVDGQLMIASRWEVESESGQDMAFKSQFFNSAFCLHWAENTILDKVWPTVEQAIASMTGLEEPRVFKCPFCESDFKLRVQNCTGSRMKIILIVWRNYGRRYGLANERMFHREPPSRIDAAALSRRDLPAVFESYRSGTDSVRFR